jgi:hypothetical protein
MASTALQEAILDSEALPAINCECLAELTEQGIHLNVCCLADHVIIDAEVWPVSPNIISRVAHVPD